MLEEKLIDTPEIFTLETIQVSYGNQSTPHASVRIRTVDGEIREESAEGNGSVDAIYNAIDQATKETVELEDYSIKSVSQGKDALGEVHVILKQDDISAQGRGLSTDILEASARAYLDAVNRLLDKSKSPSKRDKMSLI